MHRSTEITSFASLRPSTRAVVRELLRVGPLSRAELARRLDLSPASLTKLTRPLVNSGLVREESAPSARPGRPGAPLVMDVARHRFLGIKITGDELWAVATDAGGAVQKAVHRALLGTDVETVTGQIVEVMNELDPDGSAQALGVGLAGRMLHFDDTVRDNGYLGWDDVPLARMITDATGVPTVLSGDARALTAGVQWSGPGRGYDDFAVVTIGVGIGVGLVLGGQVRAGGHGTAGHVGHTPITESGPLCELGHRGCAAAVLNAAAITGAVGVPHGRADLDLADVVALADAGDPAAVRALEDAGRALGTLIAVIVNLLDLPAVILAGDGLGIMPTARPAMAAALAEHLDPGTRAPRVEEFDSTFDEWARGAAVVACQWVLAAPETIGTHRPSQRTPSGV
ncbi:ROK family transcriptional regulator [Occultella glacieicola]|uniref:ROK family transcriptional regulator n=1 Tax=Occultella glacieicola TaxID=2518684 RepID=UPI001404E3EC|nr:ROK family transcriptional regulator [Occultella glacieicola]